MDVYRYLYECVFGSRSGEGFAIGSVNTRCMGNGRDESYKVYVLVQNVYILSLYFWEELYVVGIYPFW
mgnify:FL=1